MAKNAVSDWDTTAANNTDVGGISLAETVTKGSDVNNIIREMMAQIKGAGFSTASVPFTAASASAAASLAFAEDTDNGAHTVTVTAPAAVAADATVTLPGVTTTLVGTDTADTLTNKTLTTPTITLKQGAAPAPTAEGDIQWDTDDNALVIGDGAATKTFLPIPASTAAGDIEYYTAAKVKARLAKGTDGHILTLASGLPSWAAAPSSGQPVPTSSTFAVGAAVFAKYNSGTALADGSTCAGSLVFPYVGNSSNGLNAGVAQSGTWKNISGKTLDTDTGDWGGYFVRTA